MPRRKCCCACTRRSPVAIAHGYAKVTGKAMAAAVHSNVGLFHATMAIFNAWCDRMPILVLGATGPVDAAKRRPWIDWIHTAADQGAIVRNYTKWDDQPASPAAAREALLRGFWIANTAPQGPVYINLDADMQEVGAGKAAAASRRRRASCRRSPVPPPADSRHGGRRLAQGREAPGDPRRPGVARRHRLASNASPSPRRSAPMCAPSLKVGAAFPTDHPLHVDAPQAFTKDELTPLLRQADVILSLDWVDLAGTLKPLGGAPAGKVIQVSLDHQLHNGWSMDYQGLPPVDLFIAADPDIGGRGAAARRSGRPPQGVVGRRGRCISRRAAPSARSASRTSPMRCAAPSASAT